MASTQKWLPIYVHWRWDEKVHYRAKNPCISRVNTFLNQNTDAFTACASYDTQKLGTLVNGIPPLHFRWMGGPFFAFWSKGSPFALWWMGSPLCTLVNGVPPLHFDEWGPTFALWSMGSSLCTSGEFSVESFLWRRAFAQNVRPLLSGQYTNLVTFSTCISTMPTQPTQNTIFFISISQSLVMRII